jgi:hypothetical protein
MVLLALPADETVQPVFVLSAAGGEAIPESQLEAADLYEEK